MNENLNLVEILKYVPCGTMLWSPVFGDCEFITIDLTNIIYPIKCQITTKDRRTTYVGFTKGGRLDIQYENGGCVLFPSEENMDWSTFRITKEHKCLNSNGFDYVDLNLPSGTKWATMNVGASKPSDYGLYFQWGDTSGYTAGQVGKDKQFNWDDYKFSINGSSSNFTNYNTAGESLELADDAANANMGGTWHMPTPTQIQELINETTITWTQQDKVYGTLFTSKNGKSIFIPAAGDAWRGSLSSSGGYGGVWSSVLSADNVRYGQYLYFYSDDAILGNDDRSSGFSVRGVIG